MQIEALFHSFLNQKTGHSVKIFPDVLLFADGMI